MGHVSSVAGISLVSSCVSLTVRQDCVFFCILLYFFIFFFFVILGRGWI
jgi:hypothetical protein